MDKQEAILAQSGQFRPFASKETIGFNPVGKLGVGPTTGKRQVLHCSLRKCSSISLWRNDVRQLNSIAILTICLITLVPFSAGWFPSNAGRPRPGVALMIWLSIVHGSEIWPCPRLGYMHQNQLLCIQFLAFQALFPQIRLLSRYPIALDGLPLESNAPAVLAR